MGEKTRNSRTIVRPSPTVRSTFYFINRKLIGLTTTDISNSAALLCSTKRVRGGPQNFSNALRNQYVAIHKVVSFCSGFSQVTNLLTTQSYLLQNTATNTKIQLCFLHASWIYVTLSNILSFLRLFGFIGYTSNSNICNRQGISKMRQKSGKQRMLKCSKFSFWKAHLDYRGSTSILPTTVRLPARSL